MLTIQSGLFRSRIIKNAPKGVVIRPILGRIKQSLFDIIRFQCRGAKFLDLYAGTGSVGLEALSNGAQDVCFVENNPRCIKTIQKNITLLGVQDRSVVLHRDIVKGLFLSGKNYDIIFMGPPYKDERKVMLALTGPTLSIIAGEKLCAAHGIIVAQHHIKEPVEDAIAGFKRVRKEKYGDSMLSFFKTAERMDTGA
ncbi:MAG: 16S rRNA (guanine(966)-N(2))-methyltransferase RsmD [Elusimicrobia bacterium]|nr:16S rRNA (guanine(966)-N(2))-methyltransferase RsmD [Elusimicrobiota bacterium]MBD3411745.1 16S rRNA (guanine(966)-N(2))-methyltransferase RsmD [Elusimicrobiota bacterium]